MRLVRGAPGSGKTALVFREFGDAIRNGGANLRIVVPTATLVRHYQHELARSGLVFDPGMVVSLSRFALDCAPELQLIRAGLERALVRDTLCDTPGRLQFPEFAQVAGTRGMADVVIETMTRFDNAGCTPDRLSKIRNLSPHGRAFLRVWKEVDSAIAARGFATRGQVIRRAAAAVPSGRIWIDGFLKFSPLEAGLLRAMAANCDLTMTLTEGPLTDEARRLAIELGASDHLLHGAVRRPQTVAVRAPSPEREADEIARRILELHETGVGFPGIAVALRDVDSWVPLLRTTFDRFGIPARYYFSTPVRRHPVAVFLGGLISCALQDWEFAPTLSALRAHPAWGHSADFDRFDFRVREKMPGHGAEALLGLCDSDWLRSDIAECLKVSSWCTERARPIVWQRRLEQLAASLYRIRTVPVPADYAAIETARSHAAGLRAWSAALDTAARFLTTDDSVTLDQFHIAVLDALDTAGMQVPDNRHNVVHVMSTFEARQWRVQALFVCGMTARDYPRRTAQNLLFPDSELERLRNAGIPLRTAADEDREEELLFGSLKTRASEFLILTASARDSAGKTIVPSVHLGEMVAQSSACVPAARVSTAAPGVPGHIGEGSLAGLAEQHRTVSLTSLEDLSKCRFRFFAGRTLSLKRVPERPEERLSFSATGLIIHEAMEDWLRDQSRDFVGLFESTFDAFCRRRNILPGYKLEVERVQLRRVASKVNEIVRWPLLSSEAEAECSLNFPGGVTVTCRVDRIDDIGGGDCVIVDYKSGKTANVKKLVERKTSLQGPLYALAVRENKGLNAVAMVYLAVRENEIFGWGTIPGGPPEARLKEMRPDWIEVARSRTIERLQSFLAGEVYAQPTNPDDCQWCDFAHACRVETQDATKKARPEIVKIGVVGGN
jgi:ATP-dependent helicase/DNAse subunit B